MLSSAYCPATCSGAWSCSEASLVSVEALRVRGRQWVQPGNRHRVSYVKIAVAARAHDKSSRQLLNTEEYDDGSIMFSFGDGSDAKPAAAVSPSSSDISINRQQDSAAKQKSVHDSSQVTPESSQQPNAETKLNNAQFSFNQDLTESSSQDLQQPASTAPQQIEASTAEQASEAQHVEVEDILSSVDTTDEEASGSDSATECLWDMTPQQLEGLKVSELKDLCRQEHVKGYSKLKKDALIGLLQDQMQKK